VISTFKPVVAPTSDAQKKKIIISQEVIINGSVPDHTTLHEKDGNFFAITQFECGPGAMHISKLEKIKTGGLKAVATSYISQAKCEGGWVHCADMKTPWGSHLDSEEYKPYAKK